MATSFQARQVWKKFCSWYGADVIERKYGVQVPEDWSDVIDAIDRDRLDGVLADVRAKHPTWPPGLPEFEAIARHAGRAYDSSPPMHERLIDFVLRTKPLTPTQFRTHRCLYRFDQASGQKVTTGIVVDADGDAPGYRVMVEDMEVA